jgi:hypothetical protein
VSDVDRNPLGLRRGVEVVLCLSLVLSWASTASAQGDWFRFDDWRSYQRDWQSPPPVRKRHKPPHNKVTQPQKQAVPAGPLQVVISIAKQRATLFANDVEIAGASISTGVPGHPTPMGVFSVISKSRYHASNIYSGAPMPYMHRITWSGIALHQGPLPGYPASHGCIRLPESFAVKLWGLSKVGMRVVITRDEVAPVKFDDSHLFMPKAPAVTPAEGIAALSAGAGTTDEFAAYTGAAKQAEPPKPERVKPKPPVQVFVSRKEGRLYVRQGFEPMFEMPVTIAEADKPWGTHVFTVTGIADGKARWTALTIPSGYAERLEHRRLSAKERERREKRAADLADAPTAAQALTRFEIPQFALDRISELLAEGSALIVSDNALSDETGEETGFIVTTQ